MQDINLFTPICRVGLSQPPLSWSYQFLSGVTRVYSVSKTLGKPGNNLFKPLYEVSLLQRRTSRKSEQLNGIKQAVFISNFSKIFHQKITGIN